MSFVQFALLAFLSASFFTNSLAAEDAQLEPLATGLSSNFSYDWFGTGPNNEPRFLHTKGFRGEPAKAHLYSSSMKMEDTVDLIADIPWCEVNFPKVSPNGKFVAFNCGNNVYISNFVNRAFVPSALPPSPNRKNGYWQSKWTTDNTLMIVEKEYQSSPERIQTHVKFVSPSGSLIKRMNPIPARFARTSIAALTEKYFIFDHDLDAHSRTLTAVEIETQTQTDLGIYGHKAQLSVSPDGLWVGIVDDGWWLNNRNIDTVTLISASDPRIQFKNVVSTNRSLHSDLLYAPNGKTAFLEDFFSREEYDLLVVDLENKTSWKATRINHKKYEIAAISNSWLYFSKLEEGGVALYRIHLRTKVQELVSTPVAGECRIEKLNLSEDVVYFAKRRCLDGGREEPIQLFKFDPRGTQTPSLLLSFRANRSGFTFIDDPEFGRFVLGGALFQDGDNVRTLTIFDSKTLTPLAQTCLFVRKFLSPNEMFLQSGTNALSCTGPNGEGYYLGRF